MDADSKTRRRNEIKSRRESRWSMNSQRLEEIVAELMKPIGDARRTFDTNLSSLLEEYLTEAGLHALEQAEIESGGSDDGRVHTRVNPNFAEVAMLLQQSVSIYGKKVDYLYQTVLLVSESLNNSTLELEAGGADDSGSGEGDVEHEAEAPRRGRPRARGGVLAFEHIALVRAPGARRSLSPPRVPPPTLPRVYIELEPTPAAASLALRDAAGEPLGALREYRAAWRLLDGLLLEGEGAAPPPAPAPPIPLPELQAALEAARRAPPSPPRTSTPLPPLPAPPDCPSPAESPLPPECPPPIPLEAPKKTPRRKRRSEIHIDDLSGGYFKIFVEDALAHNSTTWNEFRLESEWIESVIDRRKLAILAVRRRLKLHALHPAVLDFRGFEVCSEAGGFRGWSAAEAAAAAAAAHDKRAVDESDDDGFFDQSGAELDGDWARRVAARAASAAPDVRALLGAVLRALPAPPAAAAWPALLAAAAGPPSHVLMATLFLASAGNVRIEHGRAPQLAGFAVRLVSTDTGATQVALTAALSASAPPAALSAPAPPPPR